MKAQLSERQRLRLLNSIVLLLYCACAINIGCKSVDENIAERSEEIHRFVPELTVDPLTLPPKELDWNTAVGMLTNNLVMRNAREQIIKSEVSIKRVFLDLIPPLTLQGIYSQSINEIVELTELTDDNFNVNVNALFQVPGFLRLRTEYYAAALTRFAAQTQYELDYRGEVINLYNLFRGSRYLKKSHMIQELQAAHPYFSSADRNELQYRQNQERIELWLGLSAAMGCYTNQWELSMDGIPDPNYLDQAPDWNNPEEIGVLFITLQAIELEGARLRELGIKFQYWPQLNMRLYSPSVYLLSGGDRGGFEFDADDVRFEASVRMKLDTNLQIRDQLRETRRNTDLLRQKLYEDSQERMKKLILARNSLSILNARKLELDARKQLLLSAREANNYESFEQSKNERIELLTEQISLEKELDSIISVLWIADESSWEECPILYAASKP